MKHIIPSPSIILSFTLGGLLLGSHLVFGFTEPGQLPAGGNVLPPLDTSAFGQAKAGGLILNTGGASTGLIVDKGSVGIGTNNPGGTLDVRGSSANPIGVFNQIGLGDIFTAQSEGNTVFRITKEGSVCIRSSCRSGWWSTYPEIQFSIKKKDTDLFVDDPSLASEGDVTLSTQSLSGRHYYDSVVIPSGATITVPPGSGGLALIAKSTITILGTINAEGSAKGTTLEASGHQAGGPSIWCHKGGSASFNSSVVVSATDTGIQVQSPQSYVWEYRDELIGGAVGAAGGHYLAGEGDCNTSGGQSYPGEIATGGGDLWIVGDTVTLGQNAVLNTKGKNGLPVYYITPNSGPYSGWAGGGGGGGGGNVVIEARTYQNEGTLFQQSGGIIADPYSSYGKGADGMVIVAIHN